MDQEDIIREAEAIDNARHRLWEVRMRLRRQLTKENRSILDGKNIEGQVAKEESHYEALKMDKVFNKRG